MTSDRSPTSWATSARAPWLEVGDGVTTFAPGDRVVTVGLDGSHAELRVAPGRPSAGASPTGLATEEAACVPVPFGTADDCLFEFGRLRGGRDRADPRRRRRGGDRRHPDGQAGRRPGAGHGVERRPARAPRASSASTTGIDYITHRLRAEAVRRLTDGRGADVIVDSVGGSKLPAQPAVPGLPRSVRHLRRRRPEAPSTARHLDHARPTTRPWSGYFLGAELFLGTRAHAMIARHLDDIAAG